MYFSVCLKIRIYENPSVSSKSPHPPALLTEVRRPVGRTTCLNINLVIGCGAANIGTGFIYF